MHPFSMMHNRGMIWINVDYFVHLELWEAWRKPSTTKQLPKSPDFSVLPDNHCQAKNNPANEPEHPFPCPGLLIALSQFLTLLDPAAPGCPRVWKHSVPESSWPVDPDTSFSTSLCSFPPMTGSVGLREPQLRPPGS